MNKPSLTATQFIAVVNDVVEVTLIADAELSFWQAQLKPAGLFPFARNQRAELSLSATRFRWMGKLTCEFTIGIAVCQRPDASEPDGMYLVHAINSSAVLAFIERTFFHTPYFPGKMQVQALPVPHVEVAFPHEGSLLRLRLASMRSPVRSAEEMWQGKIYLPAHGSSAAEYFIARLGGMTQVVDFLPAADQVEITPSASYPVLGWLLDSGLTVREWRIRTRACHARTKTFKRQFSTPG